MRFDWTTDPKFGASGEAGIDLSFMSSSLQTILRPGKSASIN